MKLKRNGFAVTALILSAAVFMTTALADTLIGSGYDSLKNSIKQSANAMEKDLDSYTFESMCLIKDNETKLIEASDVYKVDNMNKATESIGQDSISGTTNYTYYDDQVSITKYSGEDKYFVREGGNGSYNGLMNNNPFKQEHYADIEKIFDAVVGGLKDNVQVEEVSTGGKIYTGSITQTQVPALINAIASFGLKQATFQSSKNNEINIPKIKSDIFIKSVSGKATEDSEGRADSITCDIIFSGNDEKGITHDFSIEIMANLKDINETTIQKPDLTGKTIEKVESYSNTIDTKYIGAYKNNIIIEDNNQYIKIGERVLTISHIDNNAISGNYKEIYKDGYESESQNKLDFNFETNFKDNQAQFSYTNADGETEYGSISPSSQGKIYLNLGIIKPDDNTRIKVKSAMSRQSFDSEFSRVFED